MVFRKAIKEGRESEGPAFHAEAHGALGAVERNLGNYDAAIAHYQRATAIFREANYEQRMAHSSRHVGDILREHGRPEEAETYYAEALRVYRSLPQTPPLEVANALRGYALLKEHTGCIDEARQLWDEARTLYTLAEVVPGVEESQLHLAILGSD
jgi:tetratricopeptide (TPR) repeat protein